MSTLDHLEPTDLRGVVLTFRDTLAAHKAVVNRLNVYPVPDGDTGSNMFSTIEHVATELADAGDDLDPICTAIAHGSLMGAKGNSGVILCQILRGMVEVLRVQTPVDGRVLADALTSASVASYQAVQKPVEGTILTVVRESATAATAAADAGGDLLAVADAARLQGGVALENTPNLLPALAQAGVVDAGGAGFLLLLDALLHHVDGRPLPEAPDLGDEPDVFAGAHDGDGSDDLRYEVMYFLEAPDDSIPGFKDMWATIGDSIVVVGGDGLWNCHVHTDDIGAAIEAGIDVGRPRKIRITDLIEQVEEERWVREADPTSGPSHDAEPVTTGVVAVASGDGIRRIFSSLGVYRAVTGGQTMNPSTAEILAAVEATNADQVVVLPNNKNIILVAEQVDALTTKEVRVLPTRSAAEGFAALLAYDPEASVDDNLASMGEASSAVVAAEVTQAVRDSTCDLGPIREGQWIGLCRDGIVAVADDLTVACEQLLSVLIADDHGLVTIIEGEGSSAAVTRHLSVWLAEERDGVEIETHHGGQPLYPYLFGIE